MTIFGKVLIVFNLLAGGAFVYFAMQNYYGEKGKGNGRQQINAAGLRQIVLVTGLPMGNEKGGTKEKPRTERDDPSTMPTDPDAEIPFKVEMAGGFRTETISKKSLELYFQAVGDGGTIGGGPVPNQLAEVRRVKAKLDELLTARPDDKVTLLAGWLLWQAETLEEREAIQKAAADGNAKELQDRLTAKFDAVLKEPTKANPEILKPLAPEDADNTDKQKEKLAQVAESRLGSLDDSERRVRLAHLLVHLDASAAWQKRVMAVVGLRRYVAAIAVQAERFRDMSARIELIIPTDQAGYLALEQTLLRQAIDRTDLANRQAEIRKRKADEKDRIDNFVAERQTSLKAITALLNKTKAEVDELLVRQAGIEAALFEVQREVAVTLDEVYELEKRLEARERELLKLPPKPKGPMPKE
jgi:hypothetical protein